MSATANQNWPLLAGSLVSWGLQGALSVQVYLYYTSFPNDSKLRKWFVYGLFALEWAHTVCQTVGTFASFSISSPYAAALGMQFFMIGTLALTALISATVQMFYARRILIISERRLRIVAGIIIALALVQMVACIVSILIDNTLSCSQPLDLTITKTSLPFWTHYTAAMSPYQAPAIIWLGGSALVDIIIATSMSILLYRSRTMYAQTDAIINRVIRHVIESGIATAGVAVMAMILYIIDQVDSDGWTIIEDSAAGGVGELVQKTTFTLSDFPILVLSKLYVNTALLSLNNRGLLNKLSHNQNDLHTRREHGFIASVRALPLKVAGLYRRIVGQRGANAQSAPDSICGILAVCEDTPHHTIDVGPSSATSSCI